jgi:hypothetical protein
MARGIVLLCGIALLSLGVSGCADAEHQRQEQSNLKPLAVLYGRYIAQHRGSPPESETEFRAFLDQLPASDLAAFQIENIDSLFVSARDNKPYVVRYGAASGPPGPAGQPVIMYEQEGLDGLRYVASSLGAVEAVDDARFHQLVPDAK